MPKFSHNTRNFNFIVSLFFPDFPVPYMTHVDVVSSGLESLDSDVLAAASTIESARFMSNRIAHVDQDAFRLETV